MWLVSRSYKLYESTLFILELFNVGCLQGHAIFYRAPHYSYRQYMTTRKISSELTNRRNQFGDSLFKYSEVPSTTYCQFIFNFSSSTNNVKNLFGKLGVRKPQWKFSKFIDNTDRPFIPRRTEKPHSLTDEVEIIPRPHTNPYEFEIHHLRVALKMRFVYVLLF